jgi:hypothetical protein
MRSVPAALIAVFLVVPLFLAALFTVSVSTWVLDRGFYASLIDDERLYEIPAGFAKGEWEETARETGIPLLRDPALLREVVTPAWMRTQALSVLGQAFDFIERRTGTFDPEFDLAPLKKAGAAPERDADGELHAPAVVGFLGLLRTGRARPGRRDPSLPRGRILGRRSLHRGC